MDNEKDYIDNLYSDKFKNFEFQSSSEDWDLLNSKLSKSNFFKFSFATFNMYFLVGFISFAATASYLGVTNIKLSKKNEILENKIEVLIEQKKQNEVYPILIDSLELENFEDEPDIDIGQETEDNFENVEVPENKKDKLIKPTIILPQINSKNDSVYTKPDSLAIKLSSNKDSAFVKPDSSAVIVPKIQKVKRVKKTIYIKKKNVIITDTVVIKKKSK